MSVQARITSACHPQGALFLTMLRESLAIALVPTLHSRRPHRFATGAKAVEKIESFDKLREVRLAAVSPALSKVKHIMEHDAKHYLIVDGSGHLQMLPSKAQRVLLLRKVQVGLAVDAIERM